jgi:hypothetical protein
VTDYKTFVVIVIAVWLAIVGIVLNDEYTLGPLGKLLSLSLAVAALAVLLKGGL